MNDKYDTTLNLIEPRENAYLKYDSTTEEVLKGIRTALANFGTLSVSYAVWWIKCKKNYYNNLQVSKTYPPFCTATMNGECALYTRTNILVKTSDYNGLNLLTWNNLAKINFLNLSGLPRTSGGDPLRARFVTGNKLQETLEDMLITVDDNDDGTYDLTFRLFKTYLINILK